MTLALDTNILVRFLVGDDREQAKKVYTLFKHAEDDKNEFFVPLLIVMELLWVLESAYGISRHGIIEAINELASMSILKFESQDAVQQFIRSAKSSEFDLSDILIACSAKNSGCKHTITFDKKASKFALFELLK